MVYYCIRFIMVWWFWKRFFFVLHCSEWDSESSRQSIQFLRVSIFVKKRKRQNPLKLEILELCNQTVCPVCDPCTVTTCCTHFKPEIHSLQKKNAKQQWWRCCIVCNNNNTTIDHVRNVFNILIKNGLVVWMLQELMLQIE